MRNEAMADVFKVWLYATAAVLLGSWASPLLYNIGKALAEVSSSKEINKPVEWLAGLCREADFPRFFEISLLLAAVALFLPFAEWLRVSRRERVAAEGQRLQKNPLALRHALRGFLVVTGLFLLIGGALLAAGILEWRSPGAGAGKLVARAALVAVALGAVQEILFRGVAMGVFLRAMRPAAALGLSALLFALVHFLNPPPGLDVRDPEAAGVGFEMLRHVLLQFSQPRMILGNFLPLLALGAVLGFARWRTASLWLPIGLHAGWIFVSGLAGAFTVAAGQSGSSVWVVCGPTLRQGLVPLAGILLAGYLIDYLTTTETDAPEATS